MFATNGDSALTGEDVPALAEDEDPAPAGDGDHGRLRIRCPATCRAVAFTLTRRVERRGEEESSGNEREESG